MSDNRCHLAVMLIEFKGHKIFAFSDTHGMYRRLAVPADADILICAGDACEGFSPSDMQDFFDWFLSKPAALRIFVAGNHELIFDLEPEYARSLVPEGRSRPKYHVFGHVHQKGLKRKAAPGGTAYLNVSYFEFLRMGLY